MRLRMLLPRRTARLRLTLLYGGACLTFGAILLAITYLFTWSVFTGAMAAHPVPTASSASASAQQPGQSDPRAGPGRRRRPLSTDCSCLPGPASRLAS